MGLPGSLVDANVTFTGVTHGFPRDIDALLVGPGGQSTTMMSDSCGQSGTPLNNHNFTFDDAASAPLPRGIVPVAQCVSGTYQPSNYDGADNFFPPAPGGLHSTTALSTFNGGPLNGTWSLFVQDDTAGDDGSIDSWSLDLLPRVKCAGKRATRGVDVGTKGLNVLKGNAQRNVMVGLAGKDTIRGLRGRDRICGNAGRDALIGGKGKDILRGGKGKDLLKGKAGRDICIGGGKADVAKSCEVEKKI